MYNYRHVKNNNSMMVNMKEGKLPEFLPENHENLKLEKPGH